MAELDLDVLKSLPVLAVAELLDIKVRGRKAQCFGGHDKNTPSLSFVPQKNIWKCHGCGRGGDTIKLVTEARNCSFLEAVAWLEEQFGVSANRQGRPTYRPSPGRRMPVAQLPIAPESTEPGPQPDPALFAWLMARCSRVSSDIGRTYLECHAIPSTFAEERGVRELTDARTLVAGAVREWGLERLVSSGLLAGARPTRGDFLSDEYALLFPFRAGDRVDYIQARRFQGRQKFMSPRGIAKPLYNASRLESMRLGQLVHICEGVPDALALEAHGLAAVAVLGAASFRKEWIDMFLRFDVAVVPDGDAAGDTFRNSVSSLFRQRGKRVRSLRLPPGKDIADVLAGIRRQREP